MEKLVYSTGLWSIRKGSALTVGRDDKAKTYRFNASTKIIDVDTFTAKMIEKAGKKPEDFCYAGDVIARITIPEIEKCIRFARIKKAARVRADKRELEMAIETGEAVLTLQIADQYGAELMYARRFREEEKNGYADWFKDYGFFGFAASPRIKVDTKAAREAVKNRKPDGSFPGCTNSAWIIDQAEWNRIIAVSNKNKVAKEVLRREFEKHEQRDIDQKVKSGFCFRCESYCHGDCGHYSNDPKILIQRRLNTAITEANYGIDD